MAQDLTSKMVQQQGARIGRCEEQIRATEKLLSASVAQDNSHAARRVYATIVGLPLGIAAFLYIGVYWNSSNGTGVYVGITCAFVLWLIARHVLSLPPSQTHTIMLQAQKLEKERVRLKETLKKHIAASEEEEAPPEDEDVAAS